MNKCQTAKREIRKKIDSCANTDIKKGLIQEFKSIHGKVQELISSERAISIENKFNQIVSDRSRCKFWKERKNMVRNPVLESLVIKDKNGNRLFNPDAVKEGTAIYYENLYQKRNLPKRSHHDFVESCMMEYEKNLEYETLEHNNMPSNSEISLIMAQKKNGKSTTDIRNEMLKRPVKAMEEIVCPMIKAIWENENIPSQWNKGLITSLWKGKGDKEQLKNHRGITVSSSLGSIMEQLIDNRIERLIPLTAAQGGGKKNSSTCDHLFLLRTLISVSLKQKKDTYVTFFDVAKAYDHIDNDDMLTVMWEKGLRGKAWRILRNLNKDLKASVKTRYGETRTINMLTGGRQGSRLTGRMFAKLMDLLAEEVIDAGEGFQITRDFVIGMLLWVDDVVSCVEGPENQKKMLERIDRFAKDHKLEWGQAKCKVMKIGKRSDENWKVGDMEIGNCVSYKYLGDVITSDGKNTENIRSRQNKIRSSSISINTVATSETLYKIGTSVLLNLHKKVNIPSLLTNSESWTLLKSEQINIEKTEIQCIKNMFNLPISFPTPGLIFTLGLLYTAIRVQQKQLVYLYKVLSRPPTHWTHKALKTLETFKLGWYKNIQKTLAQYQLPSDFEVIKRHTLNEWKGKVRTATELQNKRRLTDDCYKMVKGQKNPKTKTAHIIDEIEKETYKREPKDSIVRLSKQDTKLLLLARFGMLDCGMNFKNSTNPICETCTSPDDEEHRLNSCVKYREINFYDCDNKVPFDRVFTNDTESLKMIFERIALVWNVKTGKGSMNK